jgi:hypothetical protein
MNSHNLRSNRRRNETLPPWESSQREETFERPSATWGTSTWVSSQGEGPSERLSVAWGPPTWGSLQGERPSERLQVPVVDFAENDDDVIETSSRDFSEVCIN